jgi:hypothetical protein
MGVILRICIATTFLIALTTAAFAEDNLLYQNMTDLNPRVGVSVTAYIGDPLINQFDGQYEECVIPKFSESRYVIGGGIIIKSEIPICKTESSQKNYYPRYGTFNGAAGVVPVHISYNTRRNGSVYLCVTSMGMNAVCTSDRPPSDVVFEKRFVQRNGSVARRLEFFSKSGNVLKLVYSERSTDSPNPTVSRELPIDLNDGSTIRYKGAVIQIENINSTSIQYTILNGFDASNN